MMLVCKSQLDIDIQETVRTYEFSLVPRSMFAADGTMPRCSSTCKSALMNILEKLLVDLNEGNGTKVTQNEQNREQQMRVSVVDAMAEVQSLDKPEWIRKCSHIADHFTSRIFEKYSDSEELCLVYDFLKGGTRIKRREGQTPVYYRITALTHIAKVPMKRRQTRRQFYMLLMLQPIVQLSCGFTFPTQIFLFSPLDVTQVSAKTPYRHKHRSESSQNQTSTNLSCSWPC